MPHFGRAVACVLLLSAVMMGGCSNPHRATLANPGLDQQPMRGVFYFPGNWETDPTATRPTAEFYDRYPFLGGNEWNENSRVLTISIRTGVKLRVYAKTNKRIRFEVIHDLRHARFRATDATRSNARMRHTAPTLPSVCAMLDRLRADAADIVNRVIRHMRSQASLPTTPKTAVDLLFDIVKALGNVENARMLVSILLHKGSITSQPQFQSALQKLRRAGIMRAQERNRRREHVVTEQYQHPLQMLQRHSAYPHLTTRHRTRTPRASV